MSFFIELRHSNLRQGIDFSKDRCIEIGALVNPVLRRQDGNVFYLDHLSTEELKKQFSWDPNFAFDQLVSVDYVWTKDVPLDKCVEGKFDYVVASHVAEHVPDLIGWIESIRQILTSKGQLRLVLPDGRYCFDLKRQPSRLSDLLANWLKKTYCPDTHQVLDFALNKIADCQVSDVHAKYGIHPNPSVLESQFPFLEALDWGRRTLDPNHYEDVHCWVLHLNLFAELMLPLAQNDILKMACVQWYDIDPSSTSYEFTVFMAPESDREKRVASWQQLYEKTKINSSEKIESCQKNQQIEQENMRLRQEIESVYGSTSWRLTKPLRQIIEFFRR